MFAAALRLGLTSFGGPTAHIGYFRTDYVLRRRWLEEDEFADLVALAQFLPGPASSQLGFAIGMLRAGPLGGLAAWLGFTLPSAVAMIAFAYGVGGAHDIAGAGWVHGLELAAVAVVALAVWQMGARFARGVVPAAIAVAATVAVLALDAPPSSCSRSWPARCSGVCCCAATGPARRDRRSTSASVGAARSRPSRSRSRCSSRCRSRAAPPTPTWSR